MNEIHVLNVPGLFSVHDGDRFAPEQTPPSSKALLPFQAQPLPDSKLQHPRSAYKYTAAVGLHGRDSSCDTHECRELASSGRGQMVNVRELLHVVGLTARRWACVHYVKSWK